MNKPSNAPEQAEARLPGSRADVTRGGGSGVFRPRRRRRHATPGELTLVLAAAALAVAIAAAPAHAASLGPDNRGAAEPPVAGPSPALMLGIGALAVIAALAVVVRARRRTARTVDAGELETTTNRSSHANRAEANDLGPEAHVTAARASTGSADESERAARGPRWVSQLDSRIPVLPVIELQQERIVDGGDGPGEWEGLVQRRGAGRG